jgi:hypothetical protein
MYNQEEYEKENFEPVNQEAERLQIPVTTLFKPSSQIEHDITQTANLAQVDLLLIGAGSSVFEGSLLGKILGLTTRIINPERLLDTITGKEKLFETTAFDETVKHIMRNATVPVGIFLDKGLQELRQVNVYLSSPKDAFLIDQARQLLYKKEVSIHIADPENLNSQQNSNGLQKKIGALKEQGGDLLSLDGALKIQHTNTELLLISTDGWKKAIETEADWLTNAPSVLIMKHA